MDGVVTGFDSNKDMAELKSLMEYTERYAYFQKSCRHKTIEYDIKIIEQFLSLYKNKLSGKQRSHIMSKACWGVDLVTQGVRAIPLSFIYNTGGVEFIRPTTSGFAAHTDFNSALCNSVLELIERDAFMRFWYDPARAYNFEPSAETVTKVAQVIAVLRTMTNNDSLVGNYFVLASDTRLPVVLVTISSADFAKPPALIYGIGVGFNIEEAIKGALRELVFSVGNLVKAVSQINGFMLKKFANKGGIETMQDRMNFYCTSAPRNKLKFLDIQNPLASGVAEDETGRNLGSLIERFRQAGISIYGIDCTPRCFQDKNVYVTRAFSPELYPVQFARGNVLSLPVGPLSASKEIPHFFT